MVASEEAEREEYFAASAQLFSGLAQSSRTTLTLVKYIILTKVVPFQSQGEARDPYAFASTPPLTRSFRISRAWA
jgi:hypothetical protein